MNHHSCEVFISDLAVADDALVGEEGKGFRYILDGMNAERVLIAAECIGDGRFFRRPRRAPTPASASSSSARSAANPGRAVPRSRARGTRRSRRADLMRYKAAWLFDQGPAVRPRGEHGENCSRARPSWLAGNAAIDTPRSASASRRSTTIERKFRENAAVPGGADREQPRARPISATMSWGMPRSY